MKYRLFCIIGFSLTLASCAVYETPKQTKISGIDEEIMMNEVNDMVLDGEIDPKDGPWLGDHGLGGVDAHGYESDDEDGGEDSSKKVKSDITDILSSQSREKMGSHVGTPNIGTPVRYGDKIQKVYVFPYMDKNHNYYETSVMYTVLEKSHWVGYDSDKVKDHTMLDYGYGG